MNTGRSPRTADYLGHIAEAISRIQRYTEGMTAEQFLANEEKQDAVVRNFEVIGGRTWRDRSQRSRARPRSCYGCQTTGKAALAVPETGSRPAWR